MSIRFITGILAAAATIAAISAAPARADNADVRRFVGVAATALVLGAIVEEARNDKARHTGGDAFTRGYGQDHRKKKRWQKPALPGYCLRKVNFKHQKRSWAYSAYCLQRNYPAQILPGKCRSHAWYKGKSRPVYRTQCLQKNGFRTANR